MKKIILGLAMCSLIVLNACKHKKFNPVEKSGTVGKVMLFETENPNQIIGNATFFAMGENTIKMILELKYPKRANQSVAVHFHERGDCGDMGNHAQGHWNPTNEKHGKWGSSSYHSGDIGNIDLDHKGYAKLTLTTNRWSTTPNDTKNIIGLGIIVHGGVDDYETQPTGNSGSRIGCGVIMASN